MSMGPEVGVVNERVVQLPNLKQNQENNNRIISLAAKRLSKSENEVEKGLIKAPELSVGDVETKLVEVYEKASEVGKQGLDLQKKVKLLEKEGKEFEEKFAPLEQKAEQLEARYNAGDRSQALLRELEALKTQMQATEPQQNELLRKSMDMLKPSVELLTKGLEVRKFADQLGVTPFTDHLRAERDKLMGEDVFPVKVERIDNGLFIYVLETVDGQKGVVFIDTTPGKPGGEAYIAK